MAKDALEVITVRVPPDILKQLPAPSLTGERAAFIRSAIEEKLDREKTAQARREAIDAALNDPANP